MGEYALYRGQRVKIGTCESLYYLRADQARAVVALDGHVHPLADREHVRFRFPFADEDHVAPGAHDPYARGLRLDGVSAPAELASEHYRVQFTAPQGYVASLPCPEADADAPKGLSAVAVADGVTVHRNGFAGATFLVAQRYVDGELWPVLRCACRMMWRVDREGAEEVVASLQAQHERYASAVEPRPGESLYSRCAARVRQGFDRAHVATLFALEGE